MVLTSRLSPTVIPDAVSVPVTGTEPPLALMARRAQYSPSAMPCGGIIRSRIVWRACGGITGAAGERLDPCHRGWHGRIGLLDGAKLQVADRVRDRIPEERLDRNLGGTGAGIVELHPAAPGPVVDEDRVGCDEDSLRQEPGRTKEQEEREDMSHQKTVMVQNGSIGVAAGSLVGRRSGRAAQPHDGLGPACEAEIHVSARIERVAHRTGPGTLHEGIAVLERDGEGCARRPEELIRYREPDLDSLAYRER